MSLVKNFATAIDLLCLSINKGLLRKLKDYCFIETALDKETLVAKDGSLITVFSIHGSRNLVGKKELDNISNVLGNALQPIFMNQGHQLQFVFLRDFDRVESELKRSMAPYIRAAKIKGFEAVEDIFKDKIEHLKKFCSYEACYMVAISRPTLIPFEKKDEDEENGDLRKSVPIMSDSQDIFNNYQSLLNKHSSYVESLKSALKIIEVSNHIFEAKEAIREIKKSINNNLTADDWTPILPNNKNPLKEETNLYKAENDISSLMWPSVSEQIFPDDLEVQDLNTVKVGDRYIASMYMTMPQQQTTAFKDLINSIDKEIPFQISISMEGGGMKKTGLKLMAASFLAFSNSKNGLIRDAIKELKLDELEGNAIVKMKVNAITWAKSEKEINTRKQTVLRSLQGWGNSNFMLVNSDPIEGMLSAIPAARAVPIGTNFLAPVVDIIKMLPLTRQANVWSSGAVTYRTEDGKIIPFQPGSSLQTTWNYLIFAIPGSGKSVWMNCNNLATILSPDSDELPYIGIIDIGPSSSGLIQLIKDLLPAKKKHLALYKKIQNDESNAINVFDTQLGSRFPTAEEKTFLVNFLTLLITPAGRDKPYESSDNMIATVIDALYLNYSDITPTKQLNSRGQPKKYNPNVDRTVDSYIKKYQLPIDKHTTWWQIVDMFAEKAEYHIASMAQRYAMPLLSETTGISERNQFVKDTYEKPVSSETSETYLMLFTRSIAEVTSNFKMLDKPTILDISESRVISLDLDEVAKSGTAVAEKQTGIMYMLARYIIGKNFKLDDTILKNCPEIYHPYHNARIKKSRGTKKSISVDEFHRTQKSPSFREQVRVDQREGRKWNMQVLLSSQLESDFDDDMVDLSSGKVILSGGQNYDKIIRKFKLAASTEEYIRYKLTGPTKAGVPFLFSFQTREAYYSLFLYSTISPLEYWAFTTTAEDVTLKDRLTEALSSPNRARLVLSKNFPNGVKDEIERLLTTTVDDSILRDPYSYMVNKIIKTLGAE